MRYEIRYTPTCRKMLAQIQQPHRRTILERIEQLATDPEHQGKALLGPLRGYRSIHVSRFRVIYRVIRDQVEVIVLAAGIRKEGSRDDVYELAKRLVRDFTGP